MEVCTAAQADIKILWVRGPHGDDTNFDGPDGILAHAGLPPPYPNFGNLHFDEDETWTTITQTTQSQPIDLVTVATHEIGHALGLYHSNVASALMYAFYSGSHRFLDADDAAGIQNIYGTPASNNGNNLITGNNTLCINTSTTYSVPNPPSGVTFTWSSSNTALATINLSTGVATGVGNGTVLFTATANSGCGSTSFSKRVTVGTPLTPRLNGPLSSCWNANTVLNFSVASPQIEVYYNTDFIEIPSGVVVESASGANFSLRVGLFSNGGSYNVITSAVNLCDSTRNSRSARTLKINSCGSSSTAIVAMYPNPASGSVDFTLQNTAPLTASNLSSPPSPTSAIATASPSGFQISIYDGQGQLRWSSSTATSTLHFDSSRLPRGLYGVVITESGTVTRLNLALE